MLRPWIYSILYRLHKAPWDTGLPRPHLVELVDAGRIKPDAGLSVLDLGCGTGNESVYLAERGFEVYGVDYTPIAVGRASQTAAAANVGGHCRFFVGDITAPIPGITGTYDVILDFGALDDMIGAKRQGMVDTIHEYTHAGSIFVLWCFYALKKDAPRFRFTGVSQMQLTGIANRRHFFELAKRDLAAAQRTGRPLAVVMVDIDHFKRVNDTYGHPTGDDVIRVVASRLSAEARATDVVGRYGGEEFALMLPDAAADTALPERLLAAVSVTPIETRSGPIDVTVSIGVAHLRPDDTTIADLLARADESLYEAKRNGRNRVRTA